MNIRKHHLAVTEDDLEKLRRAGFEIRKKTRQEVKEDLTAWEQRHGRLAWAGSGKVGDQAYG